jgi:ATP-dependent DNA helicase PIF1
MTLDHVKDLLKKEMIFFTGGAGSGKSFLLRSLAKSVPNTIVLAPTGVAVQLLNESGWIGAKTIHSFLNLPLHRTTCNEVRMNNAGIVHARESNLLLIDEVSMIDPERLDTIDQVFRRIRKKDLPFGGINVGLFGDLAQLPPVVSNRCNSKGISEEELLRKLGYPNNRVDSANVWPFFEKIELTGSYRQQGDAEFYDVLRKMRQCLLGINNYELTDELEWLNKRCVQKRLPEGFTTLATTNATVQQINSSKLNNLQGNNVTYRAIIEGEWRDDISSSPRELTLKNGAQIICVMNDPSKRYVNGSTGKVLALNNDHIVALINDCEVEITPCRWDNWSYLWDDERNTFSVKSIGHFIQLPVILGFAMTVNRSQGLTIDNGVYFLNESNFNRHLPYVAMSRVRTSDSLSLSRAITH